MRLSDFDFHLPSELIARYPLPERTASRLFCLDGKTGQHSHKRFHEIVSLLSANDLLVLNNTRVIPARLRGFKETGGQIEMLVDRILDEKRILAHIRSSKSPKPQTLLIFNNNVQFEVLGRDNDLFELTCHDSRSVYEVIEEIGETPLPPYFQRSPEESDKERYQTVYAEHKGSVAAPTAGLHFDKLLLEALSKKGVELAYLTLHVGAGTFAPVRVDEIEKHHMHAEFVHVPTELCEKITATKAKGGRVIAVGTTSARSLEAASHSGLLKPFLGETNIFIYPGYQFQCVDALITNFHTPGSTLLMLVAAFAGYENIMQAYKIAVEMKYRFFSYGDAMFLTRT